MSWLSRWFRRRTRPAGARRPGGVRPRVEALEDRLVPTVQYFGGNLLKNVQAQALFLGSDWSGNQTYSAQTGTVNAFLTDITGGAYMDALTRAGYGVGRGTATAGYVDPTAYTAGSLISDASIQAKISADITGGHLQAPTANTLYIVYVDPSVAVNLGAGQGTTQQGILGYHGAFSGPGGAVIRYAVVTYPGGPAHNSSLGTSAVDQLTDVTSHELAEAVTDPDVNFARLGWYDPRRGEIGDITENNPAANVRLDGYLVQEVADQNDQLLAILATPPNPPPQPPPPGTLIGTTTTLTAGPVHYHWFSPPTVTLTVTITPASGTVLPTGTVQLVYNGNVLGTATIHIVNGVAVATFTVEFFQSGNYAFSVNYLGNSQFHGSSSNSVTVSV